MAALLVLAAAAPGSARPTAARYLFAPNFSANVVSVFDLRTQELIKHIDVGKAGPCCIHASKDGRTVYVVDGLSPYVTVVDVRTLTVRDQVFLPESTWGDSGSELQRDGRMFWATNLPEGDVLGIDTRTLQVTKFYPGGGLDVQPSWDGRTVFAHSSGTLRAFSTSTDEELSTLAIEGGGQMHLLPDGETLYVQGTVLNVVDVSNPAEMRVVATIPGGSHWIASLSPDGRQLWLVGRDDGLIKVIDTAKRTQVAEIPFDAYGAGVVVSSDGRAYVSVSKQATPTVEGTAFGFSYAGVVPGAALGTPSTTYRPVIDPPGEIRVYDTRTFKQVPTPPMTMPGIAFVVEVVDNPPPLSPDALDD